MRPLGVETEPTIGAGGIATRQHVSGTMNHIVEAPALMSTLESVYPVGCEPVVNRCAVGSNLVMLCSMRGRPIQYRVRWYEEN